MARGFSLDDLELTVHLDEDMSAFEQAIVEERTKSVQAIPLSKVRPNPNNNYSIEDIDELAWLIKEQGQLQPALVVPDGDKGDGYRLVAGERRYRALKKNGATAIEAIVLEALDPVDEEILLISANSYRNKTDADRAQEIARLTDLFQKKAQETPEFLKGRTLTQAVAQQAKVSPAQVSRSNRFVRLIPELQELVERKAVGLSTAQLFADLPEEAQEEISALIREKEKNREKFTRDEGQSLQKYYTDIIRSKDADVARSLEKIERLERKLAEAGESSGEQLRRQLRDQEEELRLLRGGAGGADLSAAVKTQTALTLLADYTDKIGKLVEELRQGAMENPAQQRDYQAQLDKLRALLNE